MTEAAKYEMYFKKLQGICDENNLVAHIYAANYPIRMVIQPLTDIDSQMTMLENVEENGYTSPDASITFYMKDGDLFEKIKGTFEIGDTLKGKLKNLFKKMHTFYLEFFHREIIEDKLLPESRLPNIKDAGESLPDGAEPLETFEDDDVPLPDDDDAESDADEPGTLGDLYDRAVKLVRAENKASATTLQVGLNCNYAESVMLMDRLQEDRVIAKTPDDLYEVLPYDEPDDDGADE